MQITRRQTQSTLDLCPPKAKARRSNRLGSANKSFQPFMLFALVGRRSRPRHLQSHPMLRLHGKPERAARTGKPRGARHPVQADANQLFPGPRNGGHRLAAQITLHPPVAVPVHGAQRDVRHGVLPNPQRPRGRTRRPHRDLRLSK